MFIGGELVRISSLDDLFTVCAASILTVHELFLQISILKEGALADRMGFMLEELYKCRWDALGSFSTTDWVFHIY